MTTPGRTAPSIWWFALGYFLCYVPYGALTKALTAGALPGQPPVTGLSILPLSVATSAVAMVAFLTLAGWWRDAAQWRLGPWSLPRPTRWTFLAGLATAAIVVTTTLAYTFDGVSIVFVMLLMRGGVLVIAPVVDALTGRRVRWTSWTALALSLAALAVTVSDTSDYRMTALCAADVALYLLAYLVRLRLMTRLAKSDDPAVTRRYFVEEQMVATPALLLALALLAAFAPGPLGAQLSAGFTPDWPASTLALVALIGAFSQGTGLFGGLVLLDPRENTFCVPVNRASSILAGLAASGLLAAWLSMRPPGLEEGLGAALVLAAIAVLSAPALAARWRRAPAPAS